MNLGFEQYFTKVSLFNLRFRISVGKVSFTFFKEKTPLLIHGILLGKYRIHSHALALSQSLLVFGHKFLSGLPCTLRNFVQPFCGVILEWFASVGVLKLI